MNSYTVTLSCLTDTGVSFQVRIQGIPASTAEQAVKLAIQQATTNGVTICLMQGAPQIPCRAIAAALFHVELQQNIILQGTN